MVLRIRRLLSLAILVAFAGVSSSYASSYRDEVSKEVRDKAIKIVKNVFHNVSIDTVLYSSIPNWVIAASGDQVVYVDVQRRLIFQGDVISEKDRVNLTDKAKISIMANALRKFPVENTITYVNGNGSRHLFVFEDPYCKYCRVFTEEISELTNSTVHVVLYPILKDSSVTMASKIWCASDRAKAWHDWIVDGKEPDNKGACMTPLQRNLELGHLYSVNGTPTVFVMNGHRLSGVPSADEIDRVLGG